MCYIDNFDMSAGNILSIYGLIRKFMNGLHNKISMNKCKI